MTGAADSVLFLDAEIAPGSRAGVLVRDGVVAGIGDHLSARTTIGCGGGALLPGLHDHHCHLLATAAAAVSVRCGPPEVRTAADLAAALHGAVPRDGWIRAVGYDELVAGEMDRDRLDQVRSDVAIRLQHRSGAVWYLNGRALDTVDDGSPLLERDRSGRATGRLWRADAWLRDRVAASPPDLRELSARLSSYGVTGVTDATPDLDPVAARHLTGGALDQRVHLLGGADPRMPRKIVVPDHELPSLAELTGRIERSRPRAVALHCVTHESAALVLAALGEVGTVPGDRIEHAALVPAEAAALFAELGVTVVTQPSLVALRGDEYLDRVEGREHRDLWRYASLLDAGVPVGCSSDAPYGDPDPWRSIRAATERRTPTGRRLVPEEAVPAERALAGFLSAPRSPGGPPRAVQVGAPADLVLLDRPLHRMLADPSSDHVALTMIAGRVRHARSTHRPPGAPWTTAGRPSR